MDESASKPPTPSSKGTYWLLVIGLVLGLAIGLLISLVVGFSPPQGSSELGSVVALLLSVRFLLAGAFVGLFAALAFKMFMP
jgi:hypothetical protein